MYAWHMTSEMRVGRRSNPPTMYVASPSYSAISATRPIPEYTVTLLGGINPGLPVSDGCVEGGPQQQQPKARNKSLVYDTKTAYEVPYDIYVPS